MLDTNLSGKYSIGDAITVNTDNGSVTVESEPVKLRRQLYLALLLLMENRIHESVVPYDAFTKTLPESKQLKGSVISDEAIRKVVAELNSKLCAKIIVPKAGIGYYLEPKVEQLEPNIQKNVDDSSSVFVSDFSEIAGKLNSIIDQIPDLIESSICIAFSNRDNKVSDNDDRLADDTAEPPINKNTGEHAIPNFSIAPDPWSTFNEHGYDVGDTVLRNWKLVRLLGKGAASSVFEAHRVDHGVTYKSAIKVVHSVSVTEDYRETPNQTILILGPTAWYSPELQHLYTLRGSGYIVNYEDHEIIDVDSTHQEIIIRLELLTPLSDYLLGKAMTQSDVVRFGIDISRALEHCYRHRIIHHDVKPSNIFITDWGSYKLGDFSAANIGFERTGTRQIGTLKYMAPEVYNGGQYSFDIDTYSLGLIMHELLSKRYDQPYRRYSLPIMKSEVVPKRSVFRIRRPIKTVQNKEVAELAHRMTGKPLPQIRGINSKLQSIIQKACSFDPRKRYSTPSAMREALESLLRGKEMI